MYDLVMLEPHVECKFQVKGVKVKITILHISAVQITLEKWDQQLQIKTMANFTFFESLSIMEKKLIFM